MGTGREREKHEHQRTPRKMRRLETDGELYLRINKAYGMWGAFLSHVLEARGEALDECAALVKLKREMVEDGECPICHTYPCDAGLHG
jgi:hypothetical protein